MKKKGYWKTLLLPFYFLWKILIPQVKLEFTPRKCLSLYPHLAVCGTEHTYVQNDAVAGCSRNVLASISMATLIAASWNNHSLTNFKLLINPATCSD